MENQNQYEVINQSPDIFLESGQVIVNNGAPINGTYCLIDTIYPKNFLKKIKNSPLSTMKTPPVLKNMISIPKLLGLYKCMDKCCSKIFSDKRLFILHMNLHFFNMEKRKSN